MCDATSTPAQGTRFDRLLVASLLAAAPSAPDADPCAARPYVDPRRLDAREHGAVMLARTDGKGSLRSSSRLHRLSVVCFGIPPRPNRLADPRLEGLRRYAVAVAHDTEESASRERDELVALGFADQQIRFAAAAAVRFRVKRARGSWSSLPIAITISMVFWKIHRLLEGDFMALGLATVKIGRVLALAGSRVLAPAAMRLRTRARLNHHPYLSIDR